VTLTVKQEKFPECVKRNNVIRETRHGMRGESARRCIGKITKGCEIFGLTKGDFSMIDIINHIIDEIGPCNLDIATWTAAHSEIKQAFNLLKDSRLQRVRWLVDRSFPARQKKYFSALLSKFGEDSVRLARIHAKYVLAENEEYSVALRTSMNLNLNMRIEYFEISEGTPISNYLREVTDYHFFLPREDSFSAFKNFRVSEITNAASIQKTNEKQQPLGGWNNEG